MNFDNAEYLNLATFRKTGVHVDTPVWFAEQDGFFYVLSNNQAGKIKRLRNSSRCRIAPCTMLGKLTCYECDSEAFLVTDKNEEQRGHKALKNKYGWQLLLLDSGAWLGGRIKQRTYIRIRKP